MKIMSAKNTDYSVIFADEDMIVLNKRSGILIAADRYNPEAPRLDLLAEKEFGKLFAVHRIDKDTTGLLMVAKNDRSHLFLSEQIKDHSFTRESIWQTSFSVLNQQLSIRLYPVFQDNISLKQTVFFKIRFRTSKKVIL